MGSPAPRIRRHGAAIGGPLLTSGCGLVMSVAIAACGLYGPRPLRRLSVSRPSQMGRQSRRMKNQPWCPLPSLSPYLVAWIKTYAPSRVTYRHLT